MINSRRVLVTFLIGLWALLPVPADASCAGSTIRVAAPPSVIGAAMPVVWAIEPACDVIETGLLAGTDTASPAPVGQPIYGYRAAYQQEIPVAESGRYWLAAYVRDEAGGTFQSQPRLVAVAVPPRPLAGPHGSHGAPPSYSGTDDDFLQPAGEPHFASLRRGASTRTTIFTDAPNLIGQVERVISSTDRGEALSEQQAPLVLRDLVFPITPDIISPSLDFQDSFFSALGYPRTGLYIVPCFVSVPFGGPRCNPGGHNPSFPSVGFGYQETDAGGGFTTSARSEFAYFIPRPSPGKLVQSATLRAFVIVARGDPSALRLSGKSPTAIEVVSCVPPSCRLWVMWDFTEEARALRAQGGELALTPEPIPPEVVPGFSSANYSLFLNVDYPWTHGAAGVGELRLTFEQACPKSLSVNMMPQSIRPVFPPDNVVPPAISMRPTKIAVEGTVKTCPPLGGSPPADVEVTFEALAPAQGTEEAGGHAHDTRPAHAFGSFENSGGSKVTRCTVSNFNAEGMGSCTVAYRSSEVNGVETIVASGPGFPNAEAKVRVEVPGLVELPEDPAKYVRVGTPNNHAGTNDPCTPQAQAPTSRHFESFYGLPKLKEAVEQIAATILQQTGILLRVNDMSLPLGGLFDIDNNWRTDHKTHRVGRHADIGFSGIRNGVCTSFNRDRLEAAIRRKTGNAPVIHGNHFHAFIP